MLDQIAPGWIAAAGGVPSIAIGVFAFLQWWKQSKNQDRERDTTDRLTREDRARQAHDEVWKRCQDELTRAYRRVDAEEALAGHWEDQARRQHDAVWQMRALVQEARALAQVRLPPGDLPAEWSKPIPVPRLEPPPQQTPAALR